MDYLPFLQAKHLKRFSHLLTTSQSALSPSFSSYLSLPLNRPANQFLSHCPCIKMSFHRPPFNRRTNPPRRPSGLESSAFSPHRHGPLSPPTPYPTSAHSEQAVDTDDMDIDPPAVTRNGTSATGTVQRTPGIYRHSFEIDLSNRHGGMTDHQILEHARLQLSYLERANLAEDAMHRVRNCRMRLRIDIDTRSASRADAVIDIRMRMLVMQDMITDGLGWFTGLPWRHPYFNVEVMYL